MDKPDSFDGAFGIEDGSGNALGSNVKLTLLNVEVARVSIVLVDIVARVRVDVFKVVKVDTTLSVLVICMVFESVLESVLVRNVSG